MRPALLLLLAVAATPAFAQKMVPGLWEHAMTMKSDSGQTAAAMANMQKQMAGMPPEQRKMVEEMMARQGMGMGGAPNTVRFCVSPAMAEKPEMPQSDQGCQQEGMQRSGNTMRFKFRCEGPPLRTGEGEFTLQGDKAFSGRTSYTTTRQGKPESMQMTMSGRFISADCGTIKPVR
jgi:hypothetical protein